MYACVYVYVCVCMRVCVYVYACEPWVYTWMVVQTHGCEYEAAACEPICTSFFYHVGKHRRVCEQTFVFVNHVSAVGYASSELARASCFDTAGVSWPTQKALTPYVA